MMNTCHKLLAGATLAMALAACSAPGPGHDTVGSSSAGTTASGAATRTTAPPNGSSSTGGIIDDRINTNTDTPGSKR